MAVFPSLRIFGGRPVVNHERPVRSLEQQEFARHLLVEPPEEFCLRVLATLFAGDKRLLERIHHPAHAEEQRIGKTDLVVHPDFAEAALAP